MLRRAGHTAEIALHLERDAALGRQAHGAGDELVAQHGALDGVAVRADNLHAPFLQRVRQIDGRLSA